MKSNTIFCAVLALSLGTSGLAFAQNDKDVRADQANRAEHRGQVSRDDRRAPGNYGNRDGNRDGNHYGNRGRDDRRGPQDHRADGRGAGPEHNFYRGGRLPPQWRSRQYVVDDWRGHRLSAPPRGYHWVQTGGDYVLVAITTGIIASILLNQ